MKSKKRKRPIPSSSSTSYSPPSTCPWWNNNNVGKNKGVETNCRCNVYGLYQYVTSTNYESNEIDLSFWPINDCDMHTFMKSMIGCKERNNTTPITNNKRDQVNEKAPETNKVCHVQKLTFHSCIYLTNDAIRHLATYWNHRGSEKDNVDTVGNGEENDITVHNTSGKKKYPFEKKNCLVHYCQDSITRRYPCLNLPLINLDLSNCRNITNIACEYIGEHFSKLEILNISDCINVTDEGLCHIMKGCKYLNEIHLRNLENLQDEGLGYIRQNLVLMKLLRHIDLAGCTGFSNEAIICLLEGDPSPGIIYKLDLSGCKQLELGIIGLHRNFISNNVKLMKLRNLPRVSDSMMGWIASGCKNLQKIDLSESTIANDLTLAYLFNGCKRLKSLCLNHCRYLTENDLAIIDSEIGRRLLEIELIECENLHESITRMVQLCPNLLKLNLRGVPLICNKTIIALATSCPHLEYLDLSAQPIKCSKSTKSYTPRVGSEGIKTLGNCCHKLRILRLNGCTRLDDACITSVAKGCPLLEELALKYCYRITDEAIKAIGENCSLITHIHLSSCKNVSDDGVKRLSQGCQNLEVVDLMGVTQITDNSIVSMAIHCKKLKRLNLRDCYRLSDKSLRSLTELCSRLEDIDMYAVDKLSNASVSNLNKCCPFLRSLDVGGTDVSDVMLHRVSKMLYCSAKKRKKVGLEPLHKQVEVHRQHVKYMSFLLKHQMVLFCAVKKYFLKKRLHHRRYLFLQCQKIQCLYRNYRNIIVLRAIAEMMRHERRRKLMISLKANLVIAFFQMVHWRNNFLKTRSACIIIQNFMKRSNTKKKKKEEKEQSECYHKIHDIAVVDTYIETVEDVEKTEESRQTIEVNESTVLRWETTVLSIIRFQQEQQRHLSVCLIQRFWRHKIHSNKIQKLKIRKRKFKKWLNLFVCQHKTSKIMKSWAKFTIQKHFRRKLQWDSRIRNLVEESKRQREIATSSKKLALYLQARWRILKAKKEVTIVKRKRWSQKIKIHSTIKIQSWWRKLLSLAKYHHKCDVLQKWKELVKGKCWKTKHKAATVIQLGIRLWKQKEVRLRAAKTLTSLLPVLYIKSKQREKLLLAKQNSSAILFQRFARGIATRRMIRNRKSASIRIQQNWRVYACRQFYKNICVREQKRIRHLEIKEKERLKEERRLKLIHLLFLGTKEKAATIIQSRYRYYINAIHREELIFRQQQQEKKRHDSEEERRKAFKNFRKHRKGVKTVAKKYVGNAISMISNVKPNEIFSEMKKKINHSKEEKAEKENLFQELVKYSTLKNRGISQKSNVVRSFRDSVIDEFGLYGWFDERCEQFMLSYAIFPEEFHHLRRLWQQSLDFRGEERVSIHDFFDHVQEKKSFYGTYLFQNVGISPDEGIRFSEYMYVVIYFSLLGKLDVLKIIFKMKSKENTNHLMRKDWESLVDAMLSNESVQYSRRAAIAAFDSHASSDVHGTSILFFNDFRKIVDKFPFTAMPLLRLQAKVRYYHLGETFWAKKAKDLQTATLSLKKQYNVNNSS